MLFTLCQIESEPSFPNVEIASGAPRILPFPFYSHTQHIHKRRRGKILLYSQPPPPFPFPHILQEKRAGNIFLFAVIQSNFMCCLLLLYIRREGKGGRRHNLYSNAELFFPFFCISIQSPEIHPKVTFYQENILIYTEKYEVCFSSVFCGSFVNFGPDNGVMETGKK